MSKQHSVYTYLWLSLLLLSNGLLAQKITVVDEDDSPLIGVHVRVGDRVEVTDLEGRAPLDWGKDAGQASVKLEYLGYEDLVLTKTELENRSYHCTMYPDDKLLEEIVIIGRTDARK